MKIHILFIADADGTILHVNDPRIARLINTGGGRPAALRYLTELVAVGQGPPETPADTTGGDAGTTPDAASGNGASGGSASGCGVAGRPAAGHIILLVGLLLVFSNRRRRHVTQLPR